MSQASPPSSIMSGGDLSMPYCDESDLVPSKTNIQLYWDGPPSPTTDSSERSSNTASILTLKSRLAESFSRTFTAIVVPHHRARSQSDGGHSSEDEEEAEPLIS